MVEDFRLLLVMLHLSPAPNAGSHNAGISACEEGKQFRKCVRLLQESSRSCSADAVSHNAAISACETGSNERKTFACC